MSNKVIRVGRSVKLSALILRISDIEADEVSLLIAEDASFLRSAYKIRALKRAASESGKKLTVITDDRDIFNIARHLSLRVISATKFLGVKSDKNAKKPLGAKSVSDIMSGGKSQISLKKQKDKKSPVQKPEDPNDGVKTEQIKKDVKNVKKLAKRFKSHNQATLKDVSQYPAILVDSIKSFRFSKIKNFPFSSIIKNSFLGRVKKPRLSFIVIFLLLCCAGAFFFATEKLPTTTVKVAPKTIEKQVVYNFSADENVFFVDFEKNVIPAQVFEEKYEQVFTVATTGLEEVDLRAEGIIEIRNNYNSQEQVLVGGTRFLSGNGKIFRLVEQVTVPGGEKEGGRIVKPGKITALVRADITGESYNIDPTSFVILGFKGTDRYYSFDGKSFAPMTGGFSGSRSIVSQGDLDGILEQAEEELSPLTQHTLRSSIPDSFYVLEDSLRFDFVSIDVNAEIGESADQLRVAVVARARVFAIDIENAEAAFNNYLDSLDVEGGVEYEKAESRNMKYTMTGLNYEEGRGVINIALEANQVFRRAVDYDALIEEISGKSDKEAKEILASKSEFEKISITFWPFWAKSVPKNKDDIKVEIVYLEKENEYGDESADEAKEQ